jgi:hypothetical protein
VIENIFDYLNGQDKFVIVVQYGVKPKPHIALSGYISVFEVGESFSEGNLIVKRYDEEENETVLEKGQYEISFDRYNSSTPGSYLIEVTDGTLVATYTVSVIAPTLEIENAKTVFIKGEKFSIGSSAQVYLITKAGRTLVDASQYTAISPLYNSKVTGEYTAIVSALGASGTYTVKVVQPSSVVVENAKTEFSGEEFTTGDIVVKAEVNGNEFILDASQYTVDSSTFVQNKNGTYTITVNAGGVIATYEVTVSGISTPSSGCGASAMDIIAMITALCVVSFVFKRK